MRDWGSRYSRVCLFLLVSLYFLFVPVFAHVPTFGGEGKNLNTAVPVENPEISRVLYGQLNVSESRYYTFDINEGERIVLGLTIPVKEGDQGFVPDLILMGPGLENEGKIPENMEIPQGYGARVFEGKLPESATYEGFTPSNFYSVVDQDLKAPETGKYYVVVNSPEKEGNYGIVIGYGESFSLEEWLSIPLNQIKIYQWQGQSLPFIFAPLGFTLLAGSYLIYLKRKNLNFSPGLISGFFAGLFFIGTGLSFIFQMLISLSKTSFSPGVTITLILAFINIGLGVTALILSLKGEKKNSSNMVRNNSAGFTKKRLYFFGLGVVALFFWAGWFIGPILAFGAALLPWNKTGET